MEVAVPSKELLGRVQRSVYCVYKLEQTLSKYKAGGSLTSCHRRTSPSVGVGTSNTGRIAIDDNAVIRENLPKLCAQYTERCTKFYDDFFILRRTKYSAMREILVPINSRQANGWTRMV